MLSSDHRLLSLALDEARKALAEGEVPVGAVLMLSDGRIFADHNRTSGTGSPCAHAEHLAIEAAAMTLGDWRLDGSVLASTLEPCLMCAGLCVLARVGTVVFGAPDTRFGAFGSVTDIRLMKGLNHYPEVRFESLEECGGIMRGFFRTRREAQGRMPG